MPNKIKKKTTTRNQPVSASIVNSLKMHGPMTTNIPSAFTG